MPIYLGTQKLKDIYLGTQRIKKIYLGTSLVYEKISAVTVTVLGAKNETVTITGATTTTVTLNASGSGTVSVNLGSNTFTGGVSGYVTTASITAATTVYVRPNKIVYWFGVYGYSMQLGKTGVGTNEAVDYDNYVYLRSQRNSSGNIRMTWWTAEAINLSPYSSLKARFSTTETNGWKYASYGLTRTGYGTGYAQISAKNIIETVTLNISSVTTSQYVGVSGSAYNKTGYVYANVYAIWLE